MALEDVAREFQRGILELKKMDKKEGSSTNFMPDDLLEIICILERGEKHNPYKIIRKRNYFSLIMLRLHYVPGGHGSHDFGHRGRNGVTVTQRRGTGSTNVARRDRRDRFLNSQKICHGSRGAIDLLKCAVVERGEPNKT